jgi:AraC-like DNA-binding protein
MFWFARNTFGRALALIHAEPNAPWTTQELAQRAGISRSVLHDRFLQFTGRAPIRRCPRRRRARGLGSYSR